MVRRFSIRTLGAVVLLAAGISAAHAADTQYLADFGPVAHDNSQRVNVLGMGSATATLSGSTLTVKGSFEGLPSNATGIKVVAGPSFGVPVAGTSAGPLANAAAKPAPGAQFTVASATSGDFSGTIALTDAELASLNKGGLYLVITSVKAPNGNLWGWLQTGDSVLR